MANAVNPVPPKRSFADYARAGFMPHLLPILPPDSDVSAASSEGVAKSRGKIPGKKTPSGWVGFYGWQKHEPSEADLNRWTGWGAGIGLRTGSLLAIDIDVLDANLADWIESLSRKMLGEAPVRFGRAPRRVLLYRLQAGEPSCRKRRYGFELLGLKDVQVVERLGEGQQFVVEGIHPKTLKPYSWRDDWTPVNTGIDGLTAVTVAMSDRFFDELERLLKDDPRARQAYALSRLAGTRASRGRRAAGPRRPLGTTEFLAPNDGMLIRAIRSLPNEYDYDEWIKWMCAMKAAARDQERVYEAVDEWCAKWAGYDAGAARDKWDSIGDSYVGARQLFNEAQRQSGFLEHREMVLEALFDSANGLAAPDPSGWILEDGSEVSISHAVLDRLISDADGHIVSSEGEIWKWTGLQWATVPDQDIRDLIYTVNGVKPRSDKAIRLSTGNVTNVAKEIRGMLYRERFFEAAQIGIPTRSGFISVSSAGEIKVSANDPAHLNRHIVGGRLSEDWSDILVNPPPLLGKLLAGIFQGDDDASDKIRLVAQIAGVAAAGCATRLFEPKALILYGSTAANGKSATLDILRGLVPEEAQAAIPLADLTDEKAVVGVAHKTLNAVDELSGESVKGVEKLKQLISGDPVRGREVYRSSTTFRARAQHVFATNTLPSFRGGLDQGLLRRLKVLEFNRTIPQEERIPNLAERILSEEEEAVLSLAVFGLADLASSGWRFCEPRSSELALLAMRRDVDPVAEWIEGADVGPVQEGEPGILASKLHQDCRQYLLNAGYPAIIIPSKRRVTETLKARFGNGSRPGGHTRLPVKIGNPSILVSSSMSPEEFERDD